jgi:hypothetical protein
MAHDPWGFVTGASPMTHGKKITETCGNARCLLEEGYGTCDEDGIDVRHLVVESVFCAFWGVKNEDGWWRG